MLVPRRPAEALLALAVEHEARMIVVGSASERPLTGLILGSVPHKLSIARASRFSSCRRTRSVRFRSLCRASTAALRSWA
jgi:hypothetical protein